MVAYEAMTSQCGRSVVQALVVRVDIGVLTYEDMSVVQVLVVRVDIGVVIYEAMAPQCEAMTPQCGRSVVHLVVRVDIGVVISYGTPVWEVSRSGPGCQSVGGYRSGDL